MDTWDFIHDEIRKNAPDTSWVDGMYSKLLDSLGFEVKAFLGASHNTDYGDCMARMKQYELENFKRRLGTLNKELWKKYRFRVNLTRLDGISTLCKAHVYNLWKYCEDRLKQEFVDYMEYIRRLCLWSFNADHVGEEDEIDYEAMFKVKWFGKSFHLRMWHGFSYYMMNIPIVLGKEFSLNHGYKFILMALAKLNESYKNAFIRFYKTETYHFANLIIEKEYHLHNVKNYIYNSSPNESRCIVCKGLDKTMHKVSDILVGANYPTMHPRCDCLTRPSLYLPQEKPFREWQKLVFGK